MLSIALNQPVLRTQLEVLKAHDALQSKAEREARETQRFELGGNEANLSERRTREESQRLTQPVRTLSAEPVTVEREPTPGPYGTPRLLNVVV